MCGHSRFVVVAVDDAPVATYRDCEGFEEPKDRGSPVRDPPKLGPARVPHESIVGPGRVGRVPHVRRPAR